MTPNDQADPLQEIEALKQANKEMHEVNERLRAEKEAADRALDIVRQRYILPLKQRLIGLWIMWAALQIGISETLHFIRVYGWHWLPICGWEMMWDTVTISLSAIGLFIYVKAMFSK